MAVLRLPAGTSEYLQARVRVDRDVTDPTGYTAEMALVADGTEPTEPDWAAAAWTPSGPPYYVQKVYAPAAGLYGLWVCITTGTETVVRKSGLVEYTEES